MSYVIVTKDLDRVVVDSYGTAGYITSGSFGYVTEVSPKVFNKKPFWSMLFVYSGFVVEYGHFKDLMGVCGVEVYDKTKEEVLCLVNYFEGKYYGLCQALRYVED